jgi:hypothetical protein
MLLQIGDRPLKSASEKGYESRNAFFGKKKKKLTYLSIGWNSGPFDSVLYSLSCLCNHIIALDKLNVGFFLYHAAFQV